MKKTIFITLSLCFSLIVTAQNYDIEKLKALSTIWGETYLFHPSIIRADKSVEWEKDFVEFLPKIKKDLTNEEFIKIVNTELLSKIEDPFTVVQKYNENYPKSETLKSTSSFDYIQITENQLSNIESLEYLDSLISDRNSNKALLVDLRINEELKIDRHTNTLFEYFAAMLINDEIPLCSSVMREHFGWDENNDWWFYEQKWKVSNKDKQISNSGKLMPLNAYMQELYQFMPEDNVKEYTPITRPIYFITNNGFLSYYQPELIALQTNRKNTFIINEDSGRIFPNNSNLRQYTFSDFDFILNTSFSINHGVTDLKYELNAGSLDFAQISNCIIPHSSESLTNQDFSFNISPKKYNSSDEALSQEEKILGIIKTWTIVKYFYPYPEHISGNWEKSLEKHLELSQNTSTDKEYYTLIQEMMATLNDSHVSTFHPSILDFSEIFVAPLQFDWIEDKLIITAIDETVKADISIGDEITAIDGITIQDILNKEDKRISSSNRQGLLATVLNPGYFIGAMDSKIKFDITSNGNQKTVEIPRTMYIFQFIGFGDNRQKSAIFDNEIGYLNLGMIF